jgi:CotH kinase protein/Secretion system C-terminal sorting domain
MKKSVLFNAILLFSTYSFAQTEGDVFFGTPSVHTLKFTFPYSNFTDSLTWSYDNDTYIKGDVEVDGTTYTDCGVKWKGNSSYTAPGVKKSFKIDFNEYVAGQDHDGLKKLNLNNAFKDPSFLREKLALDFYLEHGQPAPRCAYVEVYINGTLWGLYTGIEEIDNTFLKRWFGEKKGNLFKGDPNGDLKWLGATPSLYYTKYELKNNETTNDWTDLVNLIDVINNAPAATYMADLEAVLNVDEYLYSWAIEVLFANLDSYTGSGHNYYIYHDSTTNKFRFIAWDVNEAFGEFNMGMTISQLENLAVTYIPSPSTNRPLHQQMLANGYTQPLYDAVCDLINLEWSVWSMTAKIDSLSNLIRPYVYADPNKFYTNANFETNINSDLTIGGGPGGGTFPGIRSFLTNRRLALDDDMAANSCVVGIQEEINSEDLNFYPNPFTTHVTFADIKENSILVVYDISGSVVYTSTLKSTSETIDLNFLPKGIYTVNVKNAKFGTSMNNKLIKN